MYGTIADGIITTIVGMGTVFLALIFLSFVIKMMAVVFASKKKEIAELVTMEAVEEEVAEEVIEELVDDAELVAVITASIYATMGRESKLVVKSIRQVNDQAPAWNKAGRSELMI